MGVGTRMWLLVRFVWQTVHTFSVFGVSKYVGVGTRVWVLLLECGCWY